jgi:hypothetical protein
MIHHDETTEENEFLKAPSEISILGKNYPFLSSQFLTEDKFFNVN